MRAIRDASLRYGVSSELIRSVIRHESAGNPGAVSHKGAMGLMQLMPATAGFIAQRRFRGKQRNQLYEPALNMSLGQKYILHLLENDHIDGDLLLLAAAYNGGPGNLKKWQRRERQGVEQAGIPGLNVCRHQQVALGVFCGVIGVRLKGHNVLQSR